MGEARRQFSSEVAFAQGGASAVVVQREDGWHVLREGVVAKGPFASWEAAVFATGARGAAVVGRNAARVLEASLAESRERTEP
jgi:hypothetical protein